MRTWTSIALPYAAKVIRELFMNSAEAGSMGMSTVPLSELIRRRGAVFVTSVAARSSSTPAWKARSGMKRLRSGRWRRGRATLIADYLVLALPFEATAKLLPQMPPAEGADALAAKIERHEHGPICSVHLWFDREITELEHAVLLDREIHWMYNKSRLQPWRGKGSYLELVVSASRAFAALEPRRGD